MTQKGHKTTQVHQQFKESYKSPTKVHTSLSGLMKSSQFHLGVPRRVLSSLSQHPKHPFHPLSFLMSAAFTWTRPHASSSDLTLTPEVKGLGRCHWVGANWNAFSSCCLGPDPTTCHLNSFEGIKPSSPTYFPSVIKRSWPDVNCSPVFTVEIWELCGSCSRRANKVNFQKW